MLILGVLLAGTGLVVSGFAAPLVIALTHRGSDGFVMAPTSRYAVDSYAITAEQLEIMLGSQPQSRTTGSLAKFTLRATPVESGGAVFIGVGPQPDVDAYLDGVPHSELTQVRMDPFRPSYREARG